MKKTAGLILVFFLILFCAGALADVEINETNFPDANFRQYILGAGFDSNGDKKLSSDEIAAVSVIECDNKKIKSLKGIQYFTKLEKLWCSNNELTSLDVSKNTALISLYCYNNEITRLDVSHNTELDVLDCGGNKLDTLDVSRNYKLTWLNCCCSNKQRELILGDIDSLEYLDCQANRLTSLDVRKNTKLTRLECGRNELTSLDVSHNPALYELECERNQIKRLDVTKNPELEILWAHENKITELDLSGCAILLEQIKKYPAYHHDGYITYGPDYGDPLICSYHVSFDEITKVILGDTVIMPSAPGDEAPTPTPTPAPAQTTVTVGALKYKLSGSNAAVTGPKDKNAKKLTIPKTIKANGKTYKVTEIKAGAFRSMEKLTAVTIGENVKTIGKSAFQGCAKLKTITIRTKKLTGSSVKSNAFKGIYKKATFKCPSGMKNAYKKILLKKGAAKTCKFK